MAKNDVIITINAKDKASAVLKKVSGAMDELGITAKKSGEGAEDFGTDWTMLMMGINQGIQIIQAAGQAAEAAFDYTYHGAQVEQTEAAFASMMSTIGLGTDVLGEWRDAVGGTVSDLTLMSGFQTIAAGTSRELTAAFADSNVKLLQISKAASALNPQLGDTAFMYESITRGIKRNSPMILDNLGIIVKQEEANRALADALGKTVEELTAEEKSMAMLNEVVSKGDIIIEQLGGTIEAATDPWDHLTASLKNFTDQTAEATTGVGKLFDSISHELDVYNDYSAAIERANALGIDTSEIEKENNRLIITRVEATEILLGLIEEYNVVLEAEADLHQWAGESAEFHWGKSAEGIEVIEAVAEATMTADLAMRNYTEALLFNIASAELAPEAALALAYAMGLVDEKTVYATEKVAGFQSVLDGSQGSVDKYVGLVTALQTAMDKLHDVDIEITVGMNYAFGSKGMLDNYLPAIEGEVAAGGPIFAAGGLPVSAPYWVGEAGPEPFFPQQDGRIISNTEAKRAMWEGGGGGASVVNVTINTPVNLADEAFVQREITPYILEAMRQERISEYTD